MSDHLAVCRSSRLSSMPYAVNVYAVKAGSGSCFQGGCHPGGSGKVWRLWEVLDAVPSKIWRQRQSPQAAVAASKVWRW
jgi:hypothetical protein